MSRFLSTLLIFQLGIFVTVQAAGTLNFVNPNIKVDEGQGEAVLYIEKIKSDLKASSVNYRIVSSSATLGVDYQVESEGILQWGDSDQNPKNITIKLIDDLDEETNENIVIELFNPSEGVYLGDAVTATVTISGSESGSIGFAIEQYIGSENDWDHESTIKDFKRMYGKDSEFVDVTSVLSITKTMNKKFLEKS